MKRINFETAKLAKQSGYVIFGPGYSAQGEYSLYRGSGPLPAPYQAELQEWLRNEYNLNVIVDFIDNTKYYGYETIVYDSKNRQFHDEDMTDQAKPYHIDGVFDTYEDALEEGLVQGLKIVIDAK